MRVEENSTKPWTLTNNLPQVAIVKHSIYFIFFFLMNVAFLSIASILSADSWRQFISAICGRVCRASRQHGHAFIGAAGVPEQSRGEAHLGVNEPTGGLELQWLRTEPQGSLGQHWGSGRSGGSRRHRRASHRLGRGEGRPITPLVCVLVY